MLQRMPLRCFLLLRAPAMEALQAVLPLSKSYFWIAF
jgi:hypothetical protein